jgi:ribosome biogenesis GTPase A
MRLGASAVLTQSALRAERRAQGGVVSKAGQRFKGRDFVPICNALGRRDVWEIFDGRSVKGQNRVVPINWFPGHMNKARRLLSERASRSDMVLEVLDARLPVSSQNPLLGQLRGDLPCLRVLTKPDLADPAVTKQWLEQLAGERVKTLALVATQPGSRKRLVGECRALVPKRGGPAFPVRVMIAGIPNVGKSTLFNLLVGARKAEVRDQPAVTRQEQRTDVPGGLALVDTPGVLWPKLDDQNAAYRLASSGAIREAALDVVDVARHALLFMAERYPRLLSTRYQLEALSEDPDQLLEAIARRRGCLSRGVGPDLGKAARLFLGELRAGKLGRVSFEAPAERGA